MDTNREMEMAITGLPRKPMISVTGVGSPLYIMLVKVLARMRITGTKMGAKDMTTEG